MLWGPVFNAHQQRYSRSCLGFFHLFYLHTTINVMDEYKTTTESMETYISWQEVGQRVRRGSDLLTEQVRRYVQTLDRKYADRYFVELDST